jgi:hypothetical protein
MYALVSLVLPVQSATEDGLTLHEIVSNLPTDPASLAVVLLVTFSIALVAWSGRSKPEIRPPQ